MKKTWFITGTSKGFGRVWAEAALQRGDQVAAPARNLASLKALTETYGRFGRVSPLLRCLLGSRTLTKRYEVLMDIRCLPRSMTCGSG